MKLATFDGWLLEGGSYLESTRGNCVAWVSNTQRLIVGFGRGNDLETAVANALTDANHHGSNTRHIEGLDKAYAGQALAALGLQREVPEPSARDRRRFAEELQ
jgi:hypothetical protein